MGGKCLGGSAEHIGYLDYVVAWACLALCDLHLVVRLFSFSYPLAMQLILPPFESLPLRPRYVEA